MRDGMEWIVRFALPNGGDGPETVTSDGLAAEHDVILVFLLRDHYCQVSRQRARAFGDALDEFAARDAALVAALPDDRERAAFWRDRYDLPFPVLADGVGDLESPDADAAGTGAGADPTAVTDGTPRFDAFADVETELDCLPGLGVLDASTEWPRLVETLSGERIQDCPTPDDALAYLDRVHGD